MSDKKKQIRKQFREQVFRRANFCCEICGVKGYDRQELPVQNKLPLDAHHIANRNLFANGGYVKENGIAVCDLCHEKAETFHKTGIALEGFSPEDLYFKIGSSFEQANQADSLQTAQK